MLKKAVARGLGSLRGQVTRSDFYIKNIILVACVGNRPRRLSVEAEKFWQSSHYF